MLKPFSCPNAEPKFSGESFLREISIECAKIGHLKYHRCYTAAKRSILSKYASQKDSAGLSPAYLQRLFAWQAEHNHDSHPAGQTPFMSALKIYNTLAREKQPFVPMQPGKEHKYVCGMTEKENSQHSQAREKEKNDMVQ